MMAPATESARQIDHLQERLAAVREMISDADQPIAPEVSSLVQRLELLVEEADSMLPAIQPDEATPEAASLPGSPLQKTVPLALEKQRSNT